MVLAAVPLADSSSGGSGFTLLLPLVLIAGMIWFMSRSQRKQRQRQQATVAALNPGTRVLTTSGQVGTVAAIEDDFIVLEIAPGVSVRFVPQAIGRVLDDPETALGDQADTVEDADEPVDGLADGPEDGAGNTRVQDDLPEPDRPDAAKPAAHSEKHADN